MFAMLPEANPAAPGPRDFKRNGEPITYTCPEPSCSVFAPMLCTDQASCEAAGLSFCQDGCMPVSQCPPAVCAQNAPGACATEDTCVAEGLVWCADGCHVTGCDEPIDRDAGLNNDTDDGIDGSNPDPNEPRDQDVDPVDDSSGADLGGHFEGRPAGDPADGSNASDSGGCQLTSAQCAPRITVLTLLLAAAAASVLLALRRRA
jgi:hypothetical protein